MIQKTLTMLAMLVLSNYCLASIEVIKDQLREIENSYREQKSVPLNTISDLHRDIEKYVYVDSRVEWWKNPSGELIQKMNRVADAVTEHQEALLGYANYDGVRQGSPSTLNILYYARPSSRLKELLLELAEEEKGNGVYARSYDILFELGMADQNIVNELVENIKNKPLPKDLSSLLSLLSSERSVELVPLYAESLDAMLSHADKDHVLKAVIVQQFAKHIDGMGIVATPVAEKLEELVGLLLEGSGSDAIKNMYPMFREQVSSVVSRVKNDIIFSQPPMGYGIIVKNVTRKPNSASSESSDSSNTQVLDSRTEERAVNSITDTESVKSKNKDPFYNSNKSLYLLLYILLVILAFGGIAYFALRKKK